MRTSHVAGHASAQLLQAAPDPGFDGAQRQRQLLRQFAVAQVAQIGQADHLALAEMRTALRVFYLASTNLVGRTAAARTLAQALRLGGERAPERGAARWRFRVAHVDGKRPVGDLRVRRIELLPVVLLVRRRGAGVMDEVDPIAGFTVPVHRALTEPILLEVDPVELRQNELRNVNRAVGEKLRDWFQTREIQPQVVGEFDDSALAMEFGRRGTGIFVAPTVLAEDICRQFGVIALGEADGVSVEYYAISVERRITHPCVAASTRSARQALFAGSGKSRKARRVPAD